MIRLQDAVEIDASPEQVFDWLSHFQDNYLAWHPGHIRCRFLEGQSLLEEKAVFYIEEYLHGRLHRLKFRTTQVRPYDWVIYQASFRIMGAFMVKPLKNKALFIAQLTFGPRLPVIGRLLDWVVLKLLSDRLAAIRQHMVEEGQNLKQLLEARVHQPEHKF